MGAILVAGGARGSDVGVAEGIVYGPPRMRCRPAAGSSLWIALVECLHSSSGTGFRYRTPDTGQGVLAASVPSAAESVRDVFDIYTIIFLALAVFIFLRLRSVLGQRTGRERPPYDPYSARDAVRGAATDKVVTLPPRGTEAAPKPVEPVAEPAERWKGVAQPGSTVAAGLDAVAADDKTFDAKHFITGSRQAYEMIVTAFAEGDRRTLKNLLSREVYDGFEAAIRERENRGHSAETRFVSISAADITNAEMRGRTAHITVRFVSQLVSVTRDQAGAVIEGNPDKVTDVTDVWTFARDISSRDPNWKLVATEAGQ
jgi:predicted lipid-binding transport protein (Tim44 family)